jgi:hypothetical protein
MASHSHDQSPSFVQTLLSFFFHRFTFKILKLLNLLKVLKNTTCFGQYGHPQVLKLEIKQITENNGEHNTPSTTYVRIEGTHTIAAVPPTNFNTWGWPYWLKQVVFLRTCNEFKSFKILNVNLWNWQVFARRTENWSWLIHQWSLPFLLFLMMILEVIRSIQMPMSIWIVIKNTEAHRVSILHVVHPRYAWKTAVQIPF